MSTTGVNPFETAERWDVSTDTLLPAGNHIVTIVEAEDATAKSTGNPQLEVKLENSNGTIRDWIAYHGQFLNKIVSIYDSVGVQLPQEGEFNPADNCRLTSQCIRRLVGRKVGIVIRDEPDNRPDADPGKTRRRVAGYVPTSRITGEPDARGLPAAEPTQVQQSQSRVEDDIPF